jgi:hypothetical protein
MATTTETRVAGFVDQEKKYGENKSKSLWPVKWIDPPGQESVCFSKAGADAVQSCLGKPQEYRISTNDQGKTSVVEVVGVWKAEPSGGGRGGGGGATRSSEDRALEAAIAGHEIAATLALGLSPDDALAFVERGGVRLARAISAAAVGAPSSPASTGGKGPEPTAVAPTNGKASDAQIKALQTIASKIGWDDDVRHQMAGVKSFHDLSKDQAKELIDTWQDILADVPAEG